MSDDKSCDLCRAPASFTEVSRSPLEYRRFKVQCEGCGRYIATERFFEQLESPSTDIAQHRHIIAGCVRERFDRKRDIPELTTQNWEDLLSAVDVPRTVNDKANRVLRWACNDTEYFGHEILIELRCYPKAFAKNYPELLSLIDLLEDRGLLSVNRKGPDTRRAVKVTGRGFEAIEQLATVTAPERVFVAMWFDPQTDPTFDDAIEPAIVRSGYRPLRIKDKEHNNKIDDEIIAEIRRSQFVVADVTGHRPAVYYEAGFAHGLGKTVIWVGRKEDIEANPNFDTRQYNHVCEDKTALLEEKLYQRIRATLGEGPLVERNR